MILSRLLLWLSGAGKEYKKVKKLKRIAVGSIKLGELEPGKIVELDYNELKSLKKNY